MKQPEAMSVNDIRWASKPNKQFRLLDDEKVQFESEVENELEVAFSTDNLTLAMICLMASHIHNRRYRMSANKKQFWRKWAEHLLNGGGGLIVALWAQN